MEQQSHLAGLGLLLQVQPANTDRRYTVTRVHPRQAISDQLLVDAHITHIDDPHYAPITVDVLLDHPNLLSEHQVRYEVLGSVPEILAALRGVNGGGLCFQSHQSQDDYMVKTGPYSRDPIHRHCVGR
jgi:hypothetical protein